MPCAKKAADRTRSKIWLATGLVACVVGAFFGYLVWHDHGAIQEGRFNTQAGNALFPLAVSLISWAIGLNLSLSGARALAFGLPPRSLVPWRLF